MAKVEKDKGFVRSAFSTEATGLAIHLNCQSLGITQAELSKRLKAQGTPITESTLSRRIAGKSYPMLDEAEALCSVFGIRVSDFVQLATSLEVDGNAAELRRARRELAEVREAGKALMKQRIGKHI